MASMALVIGKKCSDKAATGRLHSSIEMLSVAGAHVKSMASGNMLIYV